MDYRIFPPEDMMEVRVKMPPSKSETARALIISALCPGGCTVEGEADCSDSRVLREALARHEGTVDVADAGTAMRFLTAYYAAVPGTDVTLTGTDRMCHRPIGPLVEALRALGADIRYLGTEGYPPLAIRGRRLAGGETSVDATVSSQFVSALMMVAPVMENGLTLGLDGELASAPYVSLTARMMRHAGADVEVQPTMLTVKPAPYTPVRFEIGGDWSAASYWYEIEALTCGFMTLEGLDAACAQADTAVASLFERLGVVTSEPEDPSEHAVELCGSPDQTPRLTVDMADTPDLVPAVTVTCAMLGIPFRITGTGSLRVKECDRVEALCTELLKIGVVVERDDEHGVMEWEGNRRPLVELPVFNTYSDHRMTMSLAPVSLYIPSIAVRDVENVEKSYPGFWDDLRSVGFLTIDAATPAEEIEQMLAGRQAPEE